MMKKTNFQLIYSRSLCFIFLLLVSNMAIAQTYYNTQVTFKGATASWYDNSTATVVGANGAVTMSDNAIYTSGPLNVSLTNDGTWTGATGATHLFAGTAATVQTLAGTNPPAWGNVTFQNRTVTFPENILIDGTLTTGATATISVAKTLKINGNLTNEGKLLFLSNATTTAQLDAFAGTKSGTGTIEIQRYIPARRAFRFLSAAITSSGTINTNWQEGAANATDNPNPAFGTHITGSTTGANGFDATPSGNPSLFTLNNATQSWESVSNTDVNTITAGTPYRILVRGDRSIDVTSNSAPPTPTTIRTTGATTALNTGTFTTTGFNETAGAVNFFGNPYPAAVDMNNVITASTNVNSAFYYIWDPTLNGVPIVGQAGGRGAYVTIDLPAGTNASGSSANQYLQPGQAAFVVTLANGAAGLQFEESHKNVAADLTSVFSISSKMDIRLYRAAAFANGETPSDGLRLKFAEDQTNAITSQDAPKFYNQDENLASSNDDRLWSIESRALPLAGESIPLFTNTYRTTDYVFEAILTEVNDITALLRDHYTGTDTVLVNNENTLYAFEVDATIPASIANDRFEIVFEEETLSSDTPLFGEDFILYPNPTSSTFYIATRDIPGDEVKLTVRSISGQKVFTKTMTVPSNGQLQVELPALSSGMYLVELTHPKGGIFTSKLIKK